MNVVITRTDGSEITIAAVAMPWQYRTMLVIDTGVDGRLTYVPIDTVERFQVEGATL